MKLDLDFDDPPMATTPAMGLDENTINQIKLGCFGLVIVGCFGFGMAQAFNPQARAIRSDIQQQDRAHSGELTLQQQQQRHSQQERQIAEQRYTEGCTLVYVLDGAGQVVSLFEGMQVVDSVTNQPLAGGMPVCDPNGATSVLGAGGMVQEIAITPDLQFVQQAIQEGRVR
jgi:hypothetical protein